MGLIDKAGCQVKTGTIYPPPCDARVAGRASLRLGDAGGLTQFGVNEVILAPGAWSSMRHWHRREGEFVMVRHGTCTLVTDAGETQMRPGECAAFPAGTPDGHHVINRTQRETRFLVVGSRRDPEIVTYSDEDLMVEIRAGAATFARKDGTPLTGENT